MTGVLDSGSINLGPNPVLPVQGRTIYWCCLTLPKITNGYQQIVGKSVKENGVMADYMLCCRKH